MSSDRAYSVLLVEDEALAVWTGRRILERLGMRVDVAESCAEARERWASLELDLVIIDGRLPDGRGLDVVADMRGRGRQELVICLTAEPELVSEAERESLGLLAVLGKPIQVDDLKASVNEGLTHLASDDDGASPPPGTREDRVGRFVVLPIPSVLTEDSLTEVFNRAAEGEAAWLALDFRETESIDSDVGDRLVEAALQLQRAGGRVCLVGTSADVSLELDQIGVSGVVDRLEDFEGLEALGRKPTAMCERSALLTGLS